MEKKIAVRYYTKTGHTKKLAEKIAETVGTTAQTIDSPVQENVDVLFLGASIYAANIDKEVLNFIDTLDKDKIGAVAVFSTSALVERSFPQIKKAIEAKGIQVIDEDFYCRGQFVALHRGRPNENDLADAAKYAAKIAQL